MNARQFATRTLKTAFYAAVAVAPIAAAVAINMRIGMNELTTAPQPFAVAELAPPPHDATKPTVVVVGSNNGTEITDFLAPYEVFAATGAFNVYAAAPERTFTPFMWGGVDYVPHYSFAELDMVLGRAPDVIVVPFIQDPKNPQIVDFIRTHTGPETIVVSICGGAYVLAATGLVDSGVVTTHSSVFPLIAREYPHITLARNVRWTDNGATVTSGGITAGIDASLHVVDRLLGRAAALDVAAQLNYPHTRFLDDPAYVVPGYGDGAVAMALNAGFRWDRPLVGVFVPHGVDEIALTAALDTFGRTFTAFSHTFAAERDVVRSRYGLYLVPRDSFATLPPVGRILLPGAAPEPAEVARLVAWAEQSGRPKVETPFASPAGNGFAFDVMLTDLTRQTSRSDARLAATSLEYPKAHLILPERTIDGVRFLPPALLGLAGMGVAFGIKRWLDVRGGVRRSRTLRAPAGSRVAA